MTSFRKYTERLPVSNFMTEQEGSFTGKNTLLYWRDRVGPLPFSIASKNEWDVGNGLWTKAGAQEAWAFTWVSCTTHLPSSFLPPPSTGSCIYPQSFQGNWDTGLVHSCRADAKKSSLEGSHASIRTSLKKEPSLLNLPTAGAVLQTGRQTQVGYNGGGRAGGRRVGGASGQFLWDSPWDRNLERQIRIQQTWIRVLASLLISV